VRTVFGAGAHFIVYKPVSREQAEGTLRAAASLIQRDRRTSFRVPIQVPLSLSIESGGGPVEGLLLDLSLDGMDVLSPKPLYSSARLSARFTLPGFGSELNLRGEVQWANPNGESGVRFTRVPERVRSELRRWLEDHRRDATGEEPTAIQNCKLTDLSLGACYIETPSPLPERSLVIFKLRAGDSELQAHGTVRVMHPSHGMGIEFAHTPEARQETEALIQFLGSQPGLEPELQVSPRSQEPGMETGSQTAGDLEDPLLELLHNHELLTQEMFLEALQSQRKLRSTSSR
jgi:PilZ domain